MNKIGERKIGDYHHLTIEGIDRIKSLYMNGANVTEIARRTEFSRPTIKRALGDLYSPIRQGGSRHRLPDEVRRAIREMYREGLYSQMELAKMHNCAESTIQTILGEKIISIHQPYDKKPLPTVFEGAIPWPAKSDCMGQRAPIRRAR